MEGFKRTGDRDEKVQNVFQQLLERLAQKKTIENKVNHHSMLMNKRDQMQRNRRFSTGICCSQSLSPEQTSTNAFKSSPFHKKKLPTNHTRHLSIKGSISNRCNVEPLANTKKLNSKIQQYNQLLTTKSYIFSGVDSPNARQLPKNSLTQVCNFQRFDKTNIRSFKKSRNRKRVCSFIQNDLDDKKKEKGFNCLNSVDFQPWEAKYGFDLF